ncbi:MAG TPA: DUF3445 domain-containing protein [Acidimicrobiales bacterium]|nr:DUF3445 domain-containing protein [Acidimicrobiales bacterium]
MAAPTPLTYLPVDARGWRLAMGMRPLTPERWLEVDENRDAELALKADLLASSRETVLALTGEGEDACRELLGEVTTSLVAFHPGVTFSVDECEHPLVAASRLVQEDLCVMQRGEDWRLVAACVCFPSRWSLAEKIGTSLDAIHSPVPGYDTTLAAPTRGVFDRLEPERSFWRLNWTLLDRPELHQPGPVRVPGGSAPEDWFFRVERQTIRRLPRSRAVVFTIRNYVTALSTLLGDEVFIENLLHSLRTAPAATREYKGWGDIAERLAARIGR